MRIDLSGDRPSEVEEEEQRRHRLAFLTEEVEYAERHLQAEVLRARARGWSWRRLAAATGCPAETLRVRYGAADTSARSHDEDQDDAAPGEAVDPGGSRRRLR